LSAGIENPQDGQAVLSDPKLSSRNCPGYAGKANLISHWGTVEISTLRAYTLERRIVLKYDMAAPFTLVPVSTNNSQHDFEMVAFDAVRAANDGPWLGHEGRAGEGAQLRMICNTLSKLQKLSRGEMLCMFDILHWLLVPNMGESGRILRHGSASR
jgi:hypothetical protein